MTTGERGLDEDNSSGRLSGRCRRCNDLAIISFVFSNLLPSPAAPCSSSPSLPTLLTSKRSSHDPGRLELVTCKTESGASLGAQGCRRLGAILACDLWCDQRTDTTTWSLCPTQSAKRYQFKKFGTDSQGICR